MNKFMKNHTIESPSNHQKTAVSIVMGLSPNGWFIMGNPLNMNDLEAPLFPQNLHENHHEKSPRSPTKSHEKSPWNPTESSFKYHEKSPYFDAEHLAPFFFPKRCQKPRFPCGISQRLHRGLCRPIRCGNVCQMWKRHGRSLIQCGAPVR